MKIREKVSELKRITVLVFAVGMALTLFTVAGEKVSAGNSVNSLEELLSELEGGAENIQVNEHIIIEDGKKYVIDFTGHNIYFLDGSLTVSNKSEVTITCSDDGEWEGSITLFDGTVNFKGGNYYTHLYSVDQDGMINIYGGTFRNKYHLINCDFGNLNIYDGYFVSEDSAALCINSLVNASLKGGTFETTNYNLGEYCCPIIIGVGVGVGALKDEVDVKADSILDTLVDSKCHLTKGKFTRIESDWAGFYYCLDVPKTTIEKHKEAILAAVPATTSANGKTEGKKCSVCKKVLTEQKTIYKASQISLSKKEYVFDNTQKTPDMVVKDSKGNTISSKYYTISKASGRKNVGTYEYTLKFKDKYSGTVKKSFVINPKGTALKTLTPDVKSFTVTYKKQDGKMASKYIDGYEIQYATKSDMSDAVKVKVTDYKKTSKTIKNLKAKKKYYVQIRTYMTVAGKKYNSPWSEKKNVTTK